jgi:hypothetical protein
MSQVEDSSRDLAQWLQEVARRRYTEPVSQAPAQFARESSALGIKALARRARWLPLRQGLSLAALVVAYLQYHLLDVMLQIEQMHTVVTFI